MINNEEFANRLKIVLQYYNLSASAFAEKIGVQRSSISHLLSGRNKPSLDFILKVLNTFDDVELYWLLNGKGTFPKKQEVKESPKKNIAPTLFSQVNEPDMVKSEDPALYQSQKQQNKTDLHAKKIKRIVIFYTDGSFEAYSN